VWIEEKKQEEEGEENPSLGPDFWARKRKKERGFSLYNKWGGWTPLLANLVGLKTWLLGPQMSSTMKGKMIIEKSSFRKVYFQGFWWYQILCPDLM
jgi:hypothetical protein